MKRKDIIKELERLNIDFSKKSNTKALSRKLEKAEIFRGVKAFRLLPDGQLQTGGVGGSIETFFEEGETYSVSDENEIQLCSHGFHFYKEGNACFGADLFEENTVLHEITAYGNVISDTEKCVAKTIKIGKKIILKLDGNFNSGFLNSGSYNSGNYNSGSYNSGNQNSGFNNSGRYNSGYRNSGNFNSGYRNSGDYNSGNSNSGNRNSGHSNSGDSNSGSYNSGERNSGRYNSGYYNSGNKNTGYFNSGDSNSGNHNSGNRNSGNDNSGNNNSGNFNSGYRNSGNFNSGNYNSGNNNSGDFNNKNIEFISIFNKPCEVKIWQNTEKPEFLFFDIKDNETYKEAFIKSWKDTTEEDRKLVEKLPNFNWEIFTDITGITKPKE